MMASKPIGKTEAKVLLIIPPGRQRNIGPILSTEAQTSLASLISNCLTKEGGSGEAAPQLGLLQAPIGLLYTATILKGRGHQVSIIDLRLPKAPSIEEVITVFGSPDLAVVATATYDLTQCYDWNLNSARHVIQQLKKSCACVAAVGVQGTLEPTLTQQETKADVILTGEFEEAVPQFLDRLISTGEVPTIFSPAGVLDLASLPIPDFSILPMQEYLSYIPGSDGYLHPAPCTLLFANRGCPYNCSFCYSEFFGGRQLRFRPVAMVLEEMERVRELGIEHVFFLDYTFTANSRWLNEFLISLSKRSLGVRWGCETRADHVDRHTLLRMAKAGCEYVWYGVESPEISNLNQRKSISRQTIEAAVRWTDEAGIIPMAFLLIGFEEQDGESMAEWASSQPFLFVANRVLPRYGTRLFNLIVGPENRLQHWDDLTIVAEKSPLSSIAALRQYQALSKLPNFFVNRIER